ncbi:protein of unknown function [Azospirillum baldaniorum]|uniref:Uncharacterized protein n=1 Tax=Azospirillum baldaniorum TaxID=1064539 RepID=A0A9P1JRP9_9PROT|nr:protein of unknown function [Azospirillum baldaniorum]
MSHAKRRRVRRETGLFEPLFERIMDVFAGQLAAVDQRRQLRPCFSRQRIERGQRLIAQRRGQRAQRHTVRDPSGGPTDRPPCSAS